MRVALWWAQERASLLHPLRPFVPVCYYYSAGRSSHIARGGWNAAELFISSFAAGALSKLASFAERHG